MQSADPLFHTRETHEHSIRARAISQTFRIKVVQPIRRADDSERFPVLYVTDSDEFFGGIDAITIGLQDSGLTPRYILVCIGYEDAGRAGILRTRDLYTHGFRAELQSEIEQAAETAVVSGGIDLKSITQTTDAAEFLEFIRDELIPFIGARYPVLPNDNSYSGYSAGGAFGLYALFTRPETFKRYILGSPVSCIRGRHFGVELARAFIETGRAMSAKVFVSVGEMEEFERGLDHFSFVTGYYQLTKYLRTSAIPGLELTARLFPGETHATAWTLAFSHGMRALWVPVAGVPYWPKAMRGATTKATADVRSIL